jgi:hypothetical protein
MTSCLPSLGRTRKPFGHLSAAIRADALIDREELLMEQLRPPAKRRIGGDWRLKPSSPRSGGI